MKVILTIDFDIIMAPYIELYNMYISPPDGVYEQLEKDFPILKNCSADLNIYKELTDYLSTLWLNKIPTHFISSHEQLISYLNFDDDINVINIDHHHDLGYHDDNDINCSNWAACLPNLKYYFWIKNFNSNLPAPEITREKSIGMANISTINFDSLPKPDLIVLCSSYPWVPSRYKYLFELWENLYKNLTH